jgi:hypothetical protein
VCHPIGQQEKEAVRPGIERHITIWDAFIYIYNIYTYMMKVNSILT